MKATNPDGNGLTKRKKKTDNESTQTKKKPLADQLFSKQSKSGERFLILVKITRWRSRELHHQNLTQEATK